MAFQREMDRNQSAFDIDGNKTGNDYSLENVRLATYGDWPNSMRQKPEQLWKLVFIILELEIGLGADDDPWEQHAYGSLTDAYVKLVKSQTQTKTYL
ncbi:hypothetical protein DOY81_011758 [Sarcophaga bullata]|nr:hypothetical protein DOY81_011758 [Sarcophaga bullata]